MLHLLFTLGGMQKLFRFILLGMLCTSTQLSLAQINLDVPFATVSPTILCSGQQAQLTAQSLLSLTHFRWYEGLLDQTPVFEGKTFETPPLFSTTSYFLASVDASDAESVRTPIIITVLPSLELPVALADPTIICSGQQSTLSVVNPQNELSYYWYNSLNATEPLDSGIAFTTPALQNSSIFYLRSQNQQGCQSLPVSVNVVVLPAINLPIVNTENPIVCTGQSVTFSVINPQNEWQYLWYTSLQDQTPVFEGIYFTTPPLQFSTTYYVRAQNEEGCLSLPSPAAVVVSPSTDVVIATPQATTICSGTSTSISAFSTLSHSSFNWYNNLTDTLPFDTGQQIQTPLLYEPQTYFVSSVSGSGCESIRTPVAITVLVNPTIPNVLTFPTVNCLTDTVRVTAYANATVKQFRFYGSIDDTLVLADVNPIYIPLTEDSTEVYVAHVNAIGCESLRSKVVLLARPFDSLAAPQLTCENDRVSWGAVPNASNYEFTNANQPEEWFELDRQFIDLNERSVVAVRTTSKQACVSPFSKIATIKCGNPIAIPEIITPNNDGFNDCWLLPSVISEEENKVELIHQQSSFTKKWVNYNNTNQPFGSEQPDKGVYIYHISMTKTGKVYTGLIHVL